MVDRHPTSRGLETGLADRPEERLPAMAQNENRQVRVFDMDAALCLWSSVGAAPARQCTDAFDCDRCAFDRALRARSDRAELRDGLWTPLRWLEAPAADRRCRHALSGRVSFRLCAHAFECSRCAFHLDVLAPELPPGGDGVTLPRGYYVHPSHLWLRVEYGGLVRIGLDEVAVRRLALPQPLELPAPGTVLGAESALVCGPDPARALRSPISGQVLRTNPYAASGSDRVAHQPYREGWLVLVRPTALRAELSGLLRGPGAATWMAEQIGVRAPVVSRPLAEPAPSFWRRLFSRSG